MEWVSDGKGDSGRLMARQLNGKVLKNEHIRSLYYLLEVYCPWIASRIKPGQFIMLKPSEQPYPLLRRPFSVLKSDSLNNSNKGRKERLTILYKKVGKGTQKMTEWENGQRIDLIGPLGNGFTLPPLSYSSEIILVGGGIGIVSLYPLANALKGRKLYVLIGGKTREDILCLNDFKKITSNLFVATEDGSMGFHGTVIDLFSTMKGMFAQKGPYYLYSCGPMGMLKDLKRTLSSKKFIAQISLEARMGCGFGACWGCVVKTRNPNFPYQRVCKEGPVFNLKDIVWD